LGRSAIVFPRQNVLAEASTPLTDGVPTPANGGHFGRNRAKKFGRGVPRRCLVEFVALNCNQQNEAENQSAFGSDGICRRNFAGCMFRKCLHPPASWLQLEP
jgi:hypothetical protein